LSLPLYLGVVARGWMPWCIIVENILPLKTLSAFDRNDVSSINILKELFQQFVRKPGLYKVNVRRHINHSFSPGGSWCRNTWRFGSGKEHWVWGRARTWQSRRWHEIQTSECTGRNDGYATLCKISDILSGNGVTLEEHEPTLNSSHLTLLKYAPVTSCDAEVTTGDHFYLTTWKYTFW
jgi:hypothetical protein